MGGGGGQIQESQGALIARETGEFIEHVQSLEKRRHGKGFFKLFLFAFPNTIDISYELPFYLNLNILHR